jgi:LAO/AO transport system kinase
VVSIGIAADHLEPWTSPVRRLASHPVSPLSDRRSLAKAITLVESTRPEHRAQALELLAAVLPQTGGSFRIGISGTPGVGKSTFIESFGLFLCGQGLRVAVLAVDPSSTRHGGSILGDKTRMPGLAVHPDAFIRPSPSSGTLGGVARRTRESILLCEAAGFDVVIVETVGVGQSEVAVSQLTDAFVLLMAPAGGDELQGVKRGIMELSDILVVNKADGALLPVATATLADYSSALRLVRPRSSHWTPVAQLASALQGTGVAELWSTLLHYRKALSASGEWSARRQSQNVAWLWEELHDRVLAVFRADPAVREQLGETEAAVKQGTLPPGRAAEQLLQSWMTSMHNN